MGSGPGDRNQGLLGGSTHLTVTEPQWGPAPGTGISSSSGGFAASATASMGSGPGDRNQTHMWMYAGDVPAVASRGSGPGDRNQYVVCDPALCPTIEPQWGPAPGTGISATVR